MTKGTRRNLSIAVAVFGFIFVLIIISMSVATKSNNTIESTIGTIGYLDNGANGTTLAVDLESWNKMSDYAKANDNQAMGKMAFEGKVFLVTSRTKIVVIDETIYSQKQVRILEGPQKDLTGWCASDFIKGE